MATLSSPQGVVSQQINGNLWHLGSITHKQEVCFERFFFNSPTCTVVCDCGI